MYIGSNKGTEAPKSRARGLTLREEVKKIRENILVATTNQRRKRHRTEISKNELGRWAELPKESFD